MMGQINGFFLVFVFCVLAFRLLGFVVVVVRFLFVCFWFVGWFVFALMCIPDPEGFHRSGLPGKKP